MIKLMESANVRIELYAAEEQSPVVPVARLTTKDAIIDLSVDELKELKNIVENMWNVNDLYQWTKESIAERERWEKERNEPISPLGAITGNCITSKIGRNWN